MDAEQLRIEEDLRGQIAGEVQCGDLFVQMYATDGSIFEAPPLGVVRPRTRADVVAVVQYAAERKIPVYPRGAGSGLAGDSLGRGIIVDFSRFFRRIVSMTDETVTVQPGVVLAQLNERLAKVGRQFGPDPAGIEVTTMGSVVALDASGSHWPVYGSTHQHVRELEVVLGDGQVTRLSRHRVDPAVVSRQENPASYLASGIGDILTRHREAIENRPTRSLVDRSGYRLHDVVRDGEIHLARLLAGSEGTLAIVTEATLTTVPLPSNVGCVLLFFTSLGSAAQAAAELAGYALRACDLMDRRHLSLAREMDPRYEFLIPPEAEAVLLVERQADSAAGVRAALAEVEDLLIHRKKLASGAHRATDAYDQQVLWQLARRYVPTLYRLRGSTRPVPFVEDIAVPPTELPDFLQRALETLRRLQVTASIFGHAAHGQLHIRPFIDLANQEDVDKLHGLAEELYGHVWEVGGTISGEHAEGYSRTPYAAGQHGPLMEAFREVKQLFDPPGILNPGKKVLSDLAPATVPLRKITYPLLTTLEGTNGAPRPTAGGTDAPSVPALFELQLDWRPEEMTYAARMCNGCGACRTQSADTRMCPIFRPGPREEASPRAKANLARAVLTGGLPAGAVLDAAFKEVCDLCVHCHMCRLECPANVDIPKLMVEAKAAHVATNGVPLHDWAFTSIDKVCGYASRFPALANWAIGNRVMRWLMEKSLGIAQGRKLPRFSKRPFLQSSTQRRLAESHVGTGVAEKVLFFVDTYANYCDAQLAQAMIAVLEHNGVSVYVPEAQLEAGMPMISQGVLPPARRIAEKNVALLAEGVRRGYAIVSTEPSAVLALTREYRNLLADDHDAELVAGNAMEACHYLWRLHQKGGLRLDFNAIYLNVGYHAPCHMKALEVGAPAVSLLGLIPGLRVQVIEKGCSGAAGLYGFKRKNYRTSLRVGLPLITELRSGQYQAGVTQCSTCRIQMEQGSPIPTIHPIKLLAISYGLMPELRELLDSPTEALVVR